MGAVLALGFWGAIIWWFARGRHSETARERLRIARNASVHLVGGWYAMGGLIVLILALQGRDTPGVVLALGVGLLIYGLAVLLGLTRSVLLNAWMLLIPLLAIGLAASS